MPFSIIPFMLLAIPLLEIAVFVVVGGEIGVLATMALIFATAVAGTILLRSQGLGVARRIRATMEQGQVPGRDLVHGMMIMVAGVLLLTPGFVTDTLGFLLFVPQFRDMGWRFLRSRITIITPGGEARSRPRDPDIIDLESEDYTTSPREDTPWRDDRGLDKPR
ncbi:FxsA family protein [Nitratireductor basaltis]|uniref:Phage T7 F exclusion suppressor FxsA n=1 Tax=Nitratireductor basaltis TaxID=472175 RepID=A0A084U6C0_9HYPH|nr:FxsA family protein [Nitratireductor basaltis]KFB08506.1 Phage T7 F exclusion suppressor FxsA [Nitratireductor basaltis]